ncbi:TPA: type IVB secretion system protein IcmH/DotU [Serratia marcescens]
MAPAANPLVDAANPLLNAISQIRQSATHANPAQLRQQLIDEMRRFEIRGQRANLPYEVIIGARYCLCTALDEAAALTDAPRDKCAHSREINGIAAAFQYSQKNYNPTASSCL